MSELRITAPQNVVAFPGSGSVAGGGGPPHNPGMETRVSAVEGAIVEIRATLGRMEGVLGHLEVLLGKVDDRTRKTELDIAELKGRVSQLPTAIQMISLVLGVLAIAGLSAYFGVRPR